MNFKIISKKEQGEILGEDYNRLAWGWYFPKSALGAIGARLILDRYSLESVPGRVAGLGTNPKIDKTCYHMTYEAKLLTILKEFMTDQGMSISSTDIIYGEYNDFRMLATPNGSYGYVYLSVWAV